MRDIIQSITLGILIVLGLTAWMDHNETMVYLQTHCELGGKK